MKIKTETTIFATALALVAGLAVLGQAAYALSCAVRDSACNAGENILFSMHSQNNSHVGMADYYQYLVCCDEVTASLRESCSSGEDEILSFFRENNSHVAEAGYYSTKLCAGYGSQGLECSLAEECNATETCVVSLHSAGNSHAGMCGHYGNQLCCAKIPDLYVNNTSITANASLPVFETPVLINITVWNIGDSVASAVNVSCYQNGTYFGSDVISSVPADASKETPRYASCVWTAACTDNVSITVDPADNIRELNESNNGAWGMVPITERLTIEVDSPINGQSVYRGSEVSLQSTVTASCDLPSYTVNWYNQSTLISTDEDTTWTIPLADELLGVRMINASATAADYVNDTANVNITVINNPPATGAPAYNVTPAEIQRGKGVEISCEVSDVEDVAASLTVNISIRDPNNVWSNVTTTDRIGSTYYRNYQTTQSNPIGNYTSVCTVVDTDSGMDDSTSTFLVLQNGTVSVDLNATSVTYNTAINVSGVAMYLDTGAITLSDVTVSILSMEKCTDTTDASGGYTCVFAAPNQVGIFAVDVLVVDKDSGVHITNSTMLTVSVEYGEPKPAEESAQNVGCYEVPSLVQNPDGSITKSTVRICVWK